MIAVPIALTFQLAFWRHLYPPPYSDADGGEIWFWPSDGKSPWVLLGWAVEGRIP